MAELGQTDDPTQLVPGDPSDVDSKATTLTAQASRMEGVSGGLRSVDTPTWTGPASNAFSSEFSLQPPEWLHHADDLGTASGHLTTYASSLRSAQSDAAQAISLWNQGQASSQAFAEQQADDPPPEGSAPATDPGVALRQEAQAVLQAARSKVEEAGGVAAAGLGGLFAIGAGIASSANGSATGSVDTMGTDASAQGPGWTDDGYSLGSANADAYLAKVQGSAQGNLGGIQAQAQGSAMVGAEANASADITADGLNAKAGVFAGAKAEGSASATYGVADAEAEGSAQAGAGADADLDVGPDGASGKAEAFAGAKASGSVSGDVGGVGGKADAEGWAGVGATADGTANFHDGKFTIGGHVGLAIGVGGKIGGEITIDPGKIADTVGDVAHDVGDVASKGMHALGDAASDLTGGLL